MDVSVIIPCHNAEPFLAQAIGSALDQSLPPHEVIVVDDDSTDASLEIARRFESRFPGQVKVFAEQHRKAARVRNVGALAATGEALMFLDADDVLRPDTLKALISALAREPDGVAICPWFRLYLRNGRWEQWPPSCAPRQGRNPLSAWLTGWYHPPVSVMWSREGFERAGRWDEIGALNDDGDLMMRALVLGIPLVEADGGAGYYRYAPDDIAHLSGQRHTREGLRDRIRVTRKIAWLIEARGQQRRYGLPISRSFAKIASDASRNGQADLSRQAAAGAARYEPLASFAIRRSGLQRLPLASRALQLQARRAYRGIRRQTWGRLQVSGAPTQHTRPEVGFGLDLAANALRAQPSGKHMTRFHRPVVSVIVPTYNRARLIRRAIDSVLAQTFGDFEVLVIDDGSTDTTPAVIAGYDDARIRYLPQPGNLGVSAARNRGLREARGEFLAFLDSDDEWLPQKLALQIGRLRELPDDVGLVYGGVENYAGHGHRNTHIPSHRGDIYRSLLVSNVIHAGASSVAIRRCVVASAGFFDEGIPAIEDYDYWVRVARFFHVDYIEEPLIRYHDLSNVQDRKSLNVVENLEGRAWFYRKYEAEMHRAGTAHQFLLNSIRRHLANGDIAGARTLAIRAVIAAPTCWEAYRRAAGTLVPQPVKRLLARRRHA